jgi:2-methylcitrate dehydratase PrpD
MTDEDARAAEPSVTLQLVRRLNRLAAAPVTQAARTVAKQCLLDWLGVALAGRGEPAVNKLLRVASSRPVPGAGASLIGLGRRADLADACLVNGAMGHVLDYDDVLANMGHPTAPVAPAVLALSEDIGASGERTLRAFIAGVEAEARVALLAGPSHYARGWHSTATFGVFGAAAAAAHLLSLNETQTLHAFGLAGTQASGLKSVFGTMSKAFHAGRAAQSGLLAAQLAAQGFTSDPDILGSAQGFIEVQSAGGDRAEALAARTAPHILDVLFKYHAACYLTHNTIEAARRLRAEDGVRPADIASVSISVQPMHMGVCNIAAPGTGLECKFSLRMTCALALSGEDTGREDLYSDATAARPDLVALCGKISVEPDAPGAVSRVIVRLRDDAVRAREVDVGRPERDLSAQQARLEQKFRRLAVPAVGPDGAQRILDACAALESLPDIQDLMRACSGAPIEKRPGRTRA